GGASRRRQKTNEDARVLLRKAGLRLLERRMLPASATVRYCILLGPAETPIASPGQTLRGRQRGTSEAVLDKGDASLRLLSGDSQASELGQMAHAVDFHLQIPPSA